MTSLTDRIIASLSSVIDPEIRKPITELDMVDHVEVRADGTVAVSIRLTIVGCPASERIKSDVQGAVERVSDGAPVEVKLTVMTTEQRAALTERLRAGKPARTNAFGPDSLCRVIAVTSGKGGVGKSTITANLAVACAELGLKVGLIDADVHGFSIPGILGMQDENGSAPRPTRVDDLILPPVAHGVKTISIGMFVAPEAGRASATAVAWRGPMLHRTLSQFLSDVFFGDLDLLFIDMPPGTGDVAISLGQLLPNAEVLVVTTPQPAAADVAERSGILARQTGQRVIGVIENMAGFVAADKSVVDLFGSGGGKTLSERLNVPLIATVPLTLALRVCGDLGTPIVLADPADPAATALHAAAAALSSVPRGLSKRQLPLSVEKL